MMWNSILRLLQTTRSKLPNFRLVRKRILLFLTLGMILHTGIFAATPEEDAAAEHHRRKAQVIYNLSKFIDWPETVLSKDTEAFAACVMGNCWMPSCWERYSRVIETRPSPGNGVKRPSGAGRSFSRRLISTPIG